MIVLKNCILNSELQNEIAIQINHNLIPLINSTNHHPNTHNVNYNSDKENSCALPAFVRTTFNHKKIRRLIFILNYYKMINNFYLKQKCCKESQCQIP